ncbi:ZinT/AdcA family metal-binding protein [Corynebacterium cystitidis]|uniref:Zinc transport system substrate-binding protein n=1 Tax=Corynebacterium cystitidis DSM 20524 TaxID=1121357 RepID=A0A1H9RYM2_9CORY|nr:ZinT/AdcA family metal-binding protein [Corynebacterium cystitidis]WJY82137.1 zinc/cadmium-binding protein [Corynebacterium cystitidis DSM 20524]SER77748.1 zinc transport system substrate-binding protein [Corynebacterium cystitidis DSM 20524]SNV78755.1 zinc/cadmium-binding protein [Corynebacterium cystitidis]
MFSTRSRRVQIAVLAASALVLAGCAESEEGADGATTTAEETVTTTTAADDTASSESETKSDSDSDTQSKATLADWEGEWVSLGALAKTDEMKPFAEEAAKEHGESVEEVLEEVDEARKTDFAGMVIDADHIAFFDTIEEVSGGSAEDGYKYTFSESIEDEHDGNTFTWFVFEGDEGAPHKYVLLMPLHGEETLAHYHMRYGDSVDEAMNADDHWYPTFIAPGEGSDEQIAETLFHHHH